MSKKFDALDEANNLKAFVNALIMLSYSDDNKISLSTTDLYHLLKPIEEKITHIVKCLNGGLQ